MHKLALAKIAILLILTVGLSGCYGQYKAERDFWLTNREYVHFLENIDKADEKDYQNIIVQLRKLTIKYPHWRATVGIQLNIGNLYNLENEKEKAIEEYKLVLKNYPEAKEASAKALFAIGAIYQIKGNGEKAQDYFDKTQKEYPETKAVLDIPIYLARYFKAKKETDRSNAVYNEAVSKYRIIIEKNSNNLRGVSAIDYLVNCFTDRGLWQEAIIQLRKIIDDYPKSGSSFKSLFIMAQIYDKQLNDKQKAEETYKEMIEKFPKNSLSESVKKYLNSKKKINEKIQ